MIRCAIEYYNAALKLDDKQSKACSVARLMVGWLMDEGLAEVCFAPSHRFVSYLDLPVISPTIPVAPVVGMRDTRVMIALFDADITRYGVKPIV